ncbi:MAG: hypothetical protein WD602_06165 [Actinomycetota bacterium]
MSPGWIILGATALAAALFLAGRAFRRRRKRKAVEAMREQPWSPEALALLAEPLGDAEIVTEIAADAEGDARTVRLSGATRWLLTGIAQTAGSPSETETSLSAGPPQTDPVDTAKIKSLGDAQAQKELRSLLYELPAQAGDAEIVPTLEAVALTALRYYQYGLNHDSPTMPISVVSSDPDSSHTDVSMIAGYLDLERRLGRLPDDMHSARTASALLGAVAARALGIDGVEQIPEHRFVHTAVDLLLNGGAREPQEEAAVETSQHRPGENGPHGAPNQAPLRWRPRGDPGAKPLE